MVNQELVGYIRDELKDGETKASIVNTLKKEGWRAQDIESAYKQAKSGKSVPKPQSSLSKETASAPNSASKSFVGVGDLISLSFSVVAKRFWTYLGVIGMGWLVLVLVSLPIVGIFMLFIFLVPTLTDTAAGVLSLILIPIGVILFIVYIVMSFWPQLALIKAISGQDKKMGVFESYGSTKGQILPAIWVVILMSLTVGGGYLFLIFFFVPGLILAIWLGVLVYFSFFVLVNENLHGLNALKKSMYLVKNNWWGVFGRSLLFGLMILGIYLVIFAITAALSIIDETLGSIVYQLLNLGFQIIIMPFSVAFGYVMYKSLKDLKEPVDIERESSTLIVVFAVLGVIAFVLMITSIILISALAAFMPDDPEGFNDNNVLQEELEQDTEIDEFFEDFPQLDESTPIEDIPIVDPPEGYSDPFEG